MHQALDGGRPEDVVEERVLALGQVALAQAVGCRRKPDDAQGRVDLSQGPQELPVAALAGVVNEVAVVNRYTPSEVRRVPTDLKVEYNLSASSLEMRNTLHPNRTKHSTFFTSWAFLSSDEWLPPSSSIASIISGFAMSTL